MAPGSSKPSQISSQRLPSDLVTKIQQRDPAAFSLVLRVLGPRLVAMAASYVQSQDIAEDVVQDVMFHVYQLGERCAPSSSLEAYLYGAVRNEALNVVRKQRVRSKYTEQYSADTYASAARQLGDVDSLWEEERERLRAVLGELTEHQRTALQLRYQGGLTIPELAGVLQISPKGAERLMTRVKKILARYLLGNEAAP